jgi:hypothetical protein
MGTHSKFIEYNITKSDEYVNWAQRMYKTKNAETGTPALSIFELYNYFNTIILQKKLTIDKWRSDVICDDTLPISIFNRNKYDFIVQKYVKDFRRRCKLFFYNS